MNAGRFALTGVAIATACLWGTPSWALGLGRINVQSGLGEALRAEIEVTSITPEESASLRLRVASPEAYRAAGIEYNAALGGAQVTLQRLPDGRPVVKVSSDRSLADGFKALGMSMTPDTFGYAVWSVKMSQVAAILPYLLLVLILIFRPRGLLGSRED